MTLCKSVLILNILLCVGESKVFASYFFIKKYRILCWILSEARSYFITVIFRFAIIAYLSDGFHDILLIFNKRHNQQLVAERLMVKLVVFVTVINKERKKNSPG